MTPATNDRRVLGAFLKSVDGGDLVALPPDSSRYTQEDGHADAAQVAAERGLRDGEFSVLFWHGQSAERAFDHRGRLVSPLLLHWAGDHRRVVEALAQVPDPYDALDYGPDEAFEITLPDLDDWKDSFPDPSATDDVLARIRWLQDLDEDWSGADWRWVNGVVREAAPKARARVLDRLLWTGEHLDDDALDVLLADWVAIYKAGGEGMDPMRLLRLLHTRGDERYDAVLAQCLKQRSWTFRYAAAEALGEFGGDDDIPTLYKLATAKARQPSPIAANPPAIRAWLRRRSAAECRAVAEIAAEALSDPKFDAAARTDLTEHTT